MRQKKVTGNKVRADIALYHNTYPSMVKMNALCWRVLVHGHAAIVWYSIQGNPYDLPYAAVAIDQEVYINESSKIDTPYDIPDSGKVWVRISDSTTFDGKEVMEFVHAAK